MSEMLAEEDIAHAENLANLERSGGHHGFICETTPFMRLADKLKEKT